MTRIPFTRAALDKAKWVPQPDGVLEPRIPDEPGLTHAILFRKAPGHQPGRELAWSRAEALTAPDYDSPATEAACGKFVKVTMHYGFNPDNADVCAKCARRATLFRDDYDEWVRDMYRRWSKRMERQEERERLEFQARSQAFARLDRLADLPNDG